MQEIPANPEIDATGAPPLARRDGPVDIAIFTSQPFPADFRSFTCDNQTYRVTLLEDGPAAPASVSTGLVYIDWLLDEESGLELCRRLRSNPATATSHITLVLDTDSFDARRAALRAGADDYMIGPLDPARLVAKIAARLPTAAPAAPCIVEGRLQLNEAAQRVTYGNAIVRLMPNEFRLLRILMTDPNRVFSRHDIIAALGKDGHEVCDRTVDVWIGRLRRALAQAGASGLLRTVRNSGYILDPASCS